jgi:hypothetical protein
MVVAETVWGELPKWTPEVATQWFAERAEPADWAAGGEVLWSQLQERHKAKGVSVFLNDPDFRAWLDHLRWVALGVAVSPQWVELESRQSFVRLGGMPEVTQAFVAALTGADDMPKALGILLRLEQAAAADLKEYAALGVAFAVVHDQPFPKDWPHHQVDQDDVPFGDEDPVARFRDYVRAHRARNLEHDPRTLSVHELKFVVDSRISLDELAWARKEVKFPLGKFERAFSSIQYDYSRIRRQAFDWRGGKYLLAEIRKQGGICVDQAYFAAVAGKAKGIPTLYFTGQGAGGGHAWFGFMAKPGKWEPDCGRYESQNYPVGEAVDPQTWRPINDSQLELMVADLPRKAEYAAARSALAWARMNMKRENQIELVREARAILPGLPEAWFEEEAWLEKNNAAVTERKAFYGEWIRQFDKQRDFKVHAQQKLLALYKQENDPQAALLQKDIVRENRKKRFDLGIGAGVDGIFTHIEAQDWPAAEKEFKRVIRRFDDQGGGNLFYQLVRPYVLTCAEEGQWELAEDAIKYAEKKMPVGSESILEMEFTRLKLLVSRKLRPSPDEG